MKSDTVGTGPRLSTRDTMVTMNWASIKKNWRDWFGLVCRIVVGLVLVIAGGIKVFNLEESVQAVRAYKLLPFDFAPIVGYGLPIFEVIIGLLLLAGLLTRLSALAAGLSMVAFIIGIAWVWSQGIAIDCGCFGGGGVVPKLDPWTYAFEIVRDLAVAFAAFWLVWRPKTPYALDNTLFAVPQFEDSDDSDDVEAPAPAKETNVE